MPITLVFPTPSASFNEVWGMDNGDFYQSDPQELVRLGDDLSRFSRHCDWDLVRYTPTSPHECFRLVSDFPTLFRCCFMFLMISRCFVEFLFESRHFLFMFPTILSFFRRLRPLLRLDIISFFIRSQMIEYCCFRRSDFSPFGSEHVPNPYRRI